MAKGQFQTDNVIFYPEALDKKLEKELRIQFGIINVHRIKRLPVEVQTKVGKLMLANYKGIDERISTMRDYNMPLITSAIDIFPNQTRRQTIQQVKEFR